MMTMEEMFYAKKEDVWIVKPEKKEKEDGKKPEPPPKSPTALEESFGPFFPFYHPTYTPPPPPPTKAPETKNVELWVPICCEDCCESVDTRLTSFKGVSKVTCDIPKKKVTVVVSTSTSADDVVLESRKAFRKARLWTKDD